MGIVKREDILAFRVAEEVVCHDCIGDAEEKEVAEDDLIYEKDSGEEMIFCDRCHKQL